MTPISRKSHLNVKVKHFKAHPGASTHSSVVHSAAGSRRNAVALTHDGEMRRESWEEMNKGAARDG